MSDTELLNEFDNALDNTDRFEEDELKELFMQCLFTNATTDIRKDIQRIIEIINERRNETKS